MFIQTESTPNPNSMKFILDNYELCENPIEFSKTQKKIYYLIRIISQLTKMNIRGISLKLQY